ncbi:MULTISPECIES: YciI family protein [Paenibacillus]|uniref:YciI family protein n=1 Tax=Paenibacillus TaxID=44249 RepID=UPI0022B92B7F|nr:YciI family protein [Paenibacillus caseinilyticus]MCZ8518941.1 YciI family protein [Paenibacillus caseinilyticus]
MRYMLMVKGTGYSEAGVQHGREYDAAVAAYWQSLAQAGVLLAAEELLPSSAGIRIRVRPYDGEPEVQAGPFPADAGLLAGFALIDVMTEDEALQWALRMPIPAGMGRGGAEWRIELRRLAEPTDAWRDPRIEALEADLQDQLHMLQRI